MNADFLCQWTSFWSHVVDCSVPQWSVTGPLKFNGYTENLSDLIVSFMLSYHLYADDTQLLRSSSTAIIKPTVDCLQDCVTAIHQWCGSRPLQLNHGKDWTDLVWLPWRRHTEDSDNRSLIAGWRERHTQSVWTRCVTLEQSSTLSWRYSAMSSKSPARASATMAAGT